MKKRNLKIGIEIKAPKKSCDDKHCPFHGDLKIRGKTFKGVVISKDAHKTTKVEWPRRFYLPKYERYEKRRSKVKAHNPPCINAEVGNEVMIIECRPISKTKNFVIIQNNETDKS